jgi:uncharacterized Zn-finger protein
MPNTECVESEYSGNDELDSNVHLVSAVIRSPPKVRPEEQVESTSPVNKQQHRCVYCNKTFNYLSLLTRHLPVHTGDKPFHCNACGKSFTENCKLRQHLQRCNGKMTADCRGQQAQNENSSEPHEAQSSMTEQQYRCHYCSKVFATSYPYRRHMLVHTGERPYKCTLCDAAFRDRYRLRSHKERFHENMPPGGK